MSSLTDPPGPDLTATLRALKLGKLTATLPERLTLARQTDMPHADFLQLILSNEVARREAGSIALRARNAGLDWSTPGLVETRFSPDALVWVAVVFHGTAAWRNHGLIIFRFCFIEHLSSCAGQLPRLVAGSRPPGPPMGARASPRRAPAVRRGFPGRGKGDAQRHRLRRRRRP